MMNRTIAAALIGTALLAGIATAVLLVGRSGGAGCVAGQASDAPPNVTPSAAQRLAWPTVEQQILDAGATEAAPVIAARGAQAAPTPTIPGSWRPWLAIQAPAEPSVGGRAGSPEAVC